MLVGLGCAFTSELRLREGLDYGVAGRQVWVRGPWESLTPSPDIDDVIDQLCPAVMRLENARGHDDGVEYCGLLYEGADNRFYASVPSPLSPEVRRLSPKKSCRVPLVVNDPAGVRRIEADYHSHPWPDSPLTSIGDTRASVQRYSIRVQFDTTCRVLKFVPHTGEPVPAEIFVRTGHTWSLLRVIPTSDKETGEINPPLEVP